MPANLENSAMATGLERSVFIPILKNGNAKECSNYHTIALISHTSKVMLKILQARLQLYVNHELPDVQAGFRKGRGTRDQIANIRWIMKKAREFQNNIYFCFIDYAKAFDCVHHNKRLLLGRKVMTNLDSILKSRDITLPTKVHLVKAMIFPVVMYGCESWTLKKAECRRIDAFDLWC